MTDSTHQAKCGQKMIPIMKPYFPPLEVYASYLEGIWQRGCLTNNGPLCQRLTTETARFLGVPNLELVSSGTIALQLAIRALNLTGEIITTPYSFVATTNAILWASCAPIFVDIEPMTFCINPDLIEAAITSETSAILATHIYGFPCDVARIQQIADAYKLKVIYDAAHAFGVRVAGKSILLHGDCNALSFHTTKTFHTAEGGAVVCKSPELAKRIFLIKQFGHNGREEYLDIGINAKMSELNAAMGLCVLPKVDDLIAFRKQRWVWYDELLEDCRLQRPVPPAGVDHNYGFYPVVFPSPEATTRVRQFLVHDGIDARRYFHPSLNSLSFLGRELRRACPTSESISSRVLCLPMYGGLSEAEVEMICGVIKRALGMKEEAPQ
jgi:dTDP-4-amino-4,6-dideoxygalactose transaminase